MGVWVYECMGTARFTAYGLANPNPDRKPDPDANPSTGILTLTLYLPPRFGGANAIPRLNPNLDSNSNPRPTLTLTSNPNLNPNPNPMLTS